mmetsp:Transcript_12697/g.33750  ORF Transcript_12697/g.33750 Transcript_12697/m.33750 type:complete len:691 (-) Transcript_12697:111-2183(-)
MDAVRLCHLWLRITLLHLVEVLLCLRRNAVLLRDGGVLAQDLAELLSADRLLLEKHLDDLVNRLAVVAHLLQRNIVRLVADLHHVCVDILQQLLRRAVARHHAHDHVSALCAGILQAVLADVGHAEHGHHLLRNVRHHVQVRRRTRCHLRLAKYNLLSRTSSERADDACEQLALRYERRILAGYEPCQATRLSTGDERHLLHGIVSRRERSADGVANLVVGDEALAASVRHRRSFHARDDAIDRVVNLLKGDARLLATSREDGRLVEQVGEVGTAEAGGALRDVLNVNVLVERLIFCVHLENFHASLDVGNVDRHLTVEASRSQQSGVEDIRAVGCRHDDDARVSLEAIHLRQQLVERLLALVVSSSDARATLASDGVNLVDEHDARRILLRLLEEVAYARRADTDEHLDELGAGDAEEGHASLAGDRLGEERLTRTRRSDEEHALGDARTHGGESLGTLEEVHNLHEVVLRLLHARHVVERHAGVGLHLELRLALSERERVVSTWTSHAASATATLRSAREQEQSTDEEEREGEVSEEVEEDGASILLLRVRGEVHLLLAELLQEFLRGSRELHANALHAVSQLGGDRLDDGDGSVFVQVHLLDAIHVEVLEESAVGHARRRDAWVVGFFVRGESRLRCCECGEDASEWGGGQYGSLRQGGHRRRRRLQRSRGLHESRDASGSGECPVP